MRKLAMQGLLAATLCAGLALTARAADDSAKPAAQTGVGAWWSNLFGGKDKPADKIEKKIDPENMPPELTVAEREEQKRREKAALCRRMEVCDRLRQVALQKNDLDLERRADELEQEAFQLYQQRTAGYGQGVVDDEPVSPKNKAKMSGASVSRNKRSTWEDEQ